MPIMLLKLTYYSQIMLKIVLVHRQNISFSMYVHSLNGGPRIHSHAEKGSRLAYYSEWSIDFCLLFQHNFLMLLNAIIMLAYVSRPAYSLLIFSFSTPLSCLGSFEPGNERVVDSTVNHCLTQLSAPFL